ncbi:uncharacterized protein LOC134234214 [Saccostrea cucullata]|uniref:uncharacterized protein LOC134234214 n=1 Tax=Saccostrea cuccullata TaxID=36930 RepID=UPI002ED40640
MCLPVFSETGCANYQHCKKTRLPWKRHVVQYYRPCSGEQIINTTVSPILEREDFVQLKNNYLASLRELSWQIQNLTLFAVNRMPAYSTAERSSVVVKEGRRCRSSSVIVKSFEELTEIGLQMNIIHQHFSVIMEFQWNERHLLDTLCILRKIYHRHGESEDHSNTTLNAVTQYSLCIKHKADCANFYTWLSEKLQNVNNKMDRVFKLSRRFVFQGQYYIS